MIFETLQSELFRFKFHWLGSKILKILEFNLTIVAPHWKTVAPQASSIELQNPGYKSVQNSLKKPEPTEPVGGVHERKVSFGHQNASDLTLEISDLGDGEKLLAQITPYLLTKTNNQNKKGKFNSQVSNWALNLSLPGT